MKRCFCICCCCKPFSNYNIVDFFHFLPLLILFIHLNCICILLNLFLLKCFLEQCFQIKGSFLTATNIFLSSNLMSLFSGNTTTSSGKQIEITSYNLPIVDMLEAIPLLSHVQVRANRFHQSIGGGWWWLNRLRGWLIRFSG